jgi:formate dehydrogenase gamma subunit
MTEYAVRFSKKQRFEHFAVMISFILLSLTGFPQKFPDHGWARGLVSFFGGLDHTRWLHRVSGIVFSLLTVVHIGIAVLLALQKKMKMTLLPNRQDFKDAVTQVRYYLGLTDQPARFDHFDYRQKFEYWGLVMGGLVMIATGLLLYFPMLVARYLPGELIPVAKVMHSNEGLMAFLVVITWHIYNAHLAPGIFPFDKTIFDGKISKERLHHEHALEYDRLYPAPASPNPPAGRPEPPPKTAAHA